MKTRYCRDTIVRSRQVYPGSLPKWTTLQGAIVPVLAIAVYDAIHVDTGYRAKCHWLGLRSDTTVTSLWHYPYETLAEL